MVLDIKVCHNFIVEKIALKVDPSVEPCGGKYCCMTIFKMTRGTEGQVESTLLLAENDDHVLTKE